MARTRRCTTFASNKVMQLYIVVAILVAIYFFIFVLQVVGFLI